MKQLYLQESLRDADSAKLPPPRSTWYRSSRGPDLHGLVQTNRGRSWQGLKAGLQPQANGLSWLGSWSCPVSAGLSGGCAARSWASFSGSGCNSSSRPHIAPIISLRETLTFLGEFEPTVAGAGRMRFIVIAFKTRLTKRKTLKKIRFSFLKKEKVE